MRRIAKHTARRAPLVATLVATAVMLGGASSAAPTASAAAGAGTTTDTACDNFDMNGLPNCDGSSNDYVDCFETGLPSCDPFIGIGIDFTNDGGFIAEDGTTWHACQGTVMDVTKIGSTIQFVTLDGSGGTGDCPNTRRQNSAQGAMGRLGCNRKADVNTAGAVIARYHRMEFSRTDKDNIRGPERASCVNLDPESGIAIGIKFLAEITYNSTDGATARKVPQFS